MNQNPNPSKEEQEEFIRRMIEDEEFRREATAGSLFWFMRCYLPRHASIGTADFQKRIFELLERNVPGITAFAAFREGGKTSMLRAYIIHQIVTGKKHFVLIGSKTERQAHDQLKSIKREFEDPTNFFLQRDLGPFAEGSDEWGKNIVIPRYDAKIAAVSVEQTVRGISYREWRPSLIVLDDIEDLSSIKSKEATDKIQNWLERDVIPAGSQHTRIIITSNLLAEDSILTRIRKDIEEDKRDGIFRSYPLVDDAGKVAWPEKFPTPESLELEKRKHTELAWKQEFLLLPVTDDEPVIRKEWLKFYHDLPKPNAYPEHRLRLVSVDPAISDKAQADCTAIVCADIYGHGVERMIYIRRDPVNRRGLSVKETVEHAKAFYDEAVGMGRRAEVVVETVGMQSIFLEMMRDAGITRVHGFNPGRQDKRERLSLAGHTVQMGQVYFPDDEADGQLLHQILNLGSGHDDLADAFSMLFIKLTELDAKSLFIFPQDYASTNPPNLSDPEVRKEEERKLDMQTMAESEYERSGDNPALRDKIDRASGFIW